MASFLAADLPSSDEEDDDYNVGADRTAEPEDRVGSKKKGGAAGSKRRRGAVVSAKPADDGGQQASAGSNGNNGKLQKHQPTVAELTEEDPNHPRVIAKKAKLDAIWAKMSGGGGAKAAAAAVAGVSVTGAGAGGKSAGVSSSNGLSLAELCRAPATVAGAAKRAQDADRNWMASLGLIPKSSPKATTAPGSSPQPTTSKASPTTTVTATGSAGRIADAIAAAKAARANPEAAAAAKASAAAAAAAAEQAQSPTADAADDGGGSGRGGVQDAGSAVAGALRGVETADGAGRAGAGAGGGGSGSRSSPESAVSEAARAAAAAALVAAREGGGLGAGKAAGKVSVVETRRFAGKDIQVTLQVDKDSKAATKAAERAAAAAAAAKGGMDAFLAEVDKKKKVTVLDKSKMDWKDFKSTDAAVEEELETYKKSSDKYLDKVDFLKRAELRQYEQERDSRLAGDVRNRGRL